MQTKYEHYMELKTLIAECTAYDYKLMLEEKKPKSWLKSVSAFADTLGGSLIFGVANDGTVKGLDDVQHVCEVISSKIRDYMDPQPEVEIIPMEVDGKKNKPEYAERAVLEALVNHFIHRDYTVMGGEVHVDIYDDRLVFSSPGGMYSGQMVQDLPLDEISSVRRNPILADVMAQLDYMEKRGSGLRRICNETKMLESYTEDRKPVFKSSVSQFMTIIYSMSYNQDNRQVVIKQSLSSHQVVTKLSLSIPMIGELLQKMVEPMSAKDMRQFCRQKDATYFKAKVIDPLIAEGLVAMTHPESPNNPNQKYYLTDLGKTLSIEGTNSSVIQEK